MKDKVNSLLMGKSFLDEIHDEQRLKEDLGFDSLSMVELIVELEDILGVEMLMEDLDPSNFNTVADIYSLMEKYAKEGATPCAV